MGGLLGSEGAEMGIGMGLRMGSSLRLCLDLEVGGGGVWSSFLSLPSEKDPAFSLDEDGFMGYTLLGLVLRVG